jgi:hypothetical protein
MSTLHDTSELLTNIKASGSFAARRTASADDLHLEVKDVGGIPWPISTAAARRLCAAARPARVACNSVQGATAFLAAMATTATWNLQLTESKGPGRVRIPLSPPTSLARWRFAWFLGHRMDFHELLQE